ncbi:CRISPR-associated ring nuclease Crn3/Csx3 [Cronbergia sp. UHCC 0137]|uniref:CRISPR-associated ring nuclease Crn3/Csx3 n=1 Tax=Cronbergia sp. UHCC 0137 TaxID=3110239 RepID=UPI002B20268E|nr:CRISPR-associated ring nuclease Crn3/Csx3 [Cronbergia sp. UHCC 0137]MEA5620755.1 CRISPR-associated ring nuclease Crn3/Csx3 [Cronbergia sp. UHCC 0137]
MDASALRLYLSQPQFDQDLKYQVLLIELAASDRLIEPQDLINLQLPDGIDTQGGIIISGRAPIWLYAYLTQELHPTAWVACYDPRLIGAVVVATQSRLVHIGQVISINPANGNSSQENLSPHLTSFPPPANQEWSSYFVNIHKFLSTNTFTASPVLEDENLCSALMVVGPADSGKSVLSHALFKALLWENPNVYLQRAHWDGEGNYLLEMGEKATEEEIESFKMRDRGALTERFFPYQAQAILNLRRQKSLVIVDVGGMIQPEKLPILEVCTHYLIVSSKPEVVDVWHDFCGNQGKLTPVAVINSVLSVTEKLHRSDPYLEMTYGSLTRGQVRTIPEVLLQQVKLLCR